RKGCLMRCLLTGFGLLISIASIGVAQPAKPVEDLSRGEAMIENYFRKQAAQISRDCLKEYTTRDEWEKARPELQRQLREMLGLDPLPPRTDLKPRIAGTVDTDKFTIEKLTFQSLPNLHVTANFYLPKPLPKEKLPTILYLCGHGNVVKKIDGQ